MEPKTENRKRTIRTYDPKTKKDVVRIMGYVSPSFIGEKKPKIQHDQTVFDRVELNKEKEKRKTIKYAKNRLMLKPLLSVKGLSKKLRTQIIRKLNAISEYLNRNTFKPTLRHRKYVEHYNRIFEDLGSLKLHYKDEIKFSDKTVKEQFNTVKKLNSYWFFRYKGKTLMRHITQKTDKPFNLNTLKKGFTYRITFKCAFCEKTIIRTYKPKKSNRKYQYPKNLCDCNYNRESNHKYYVETDKVTSIQINRHLTVYRKITEIRDIPYRPSILHFRDFIRNGDPVTQKYYILKVEVKRKLKKKTRKTVKPKKRKTVKTVKTVAVKTVDKNDPLMKNKNRVLHELYVTRANLKKNQLRLSANENGYLFNIETRIKQINEIIQKVKNSQLNKIPRITVK